MHSKMTNISIKHHFLREKVADQEDRLEYVATKDQVADIFTKTLPNKTFAFLRQNLGVLPLSSLRSVSSERAYAQGERLDLFLIYPFCRFLVQRVSIVRWIIM